MGKDLDIIPTSKYRWENSAVYDEGVTEGIFFPQVGMRG